MIFLHHAYLVTQLFCFLGPTPCVMLGTPPCSVLRGCSVGAVDYVVLGMASRPPGCKTCAQPIELSPASDYLVLLTEIYSKHDYVPGIGCRVVRGKKVESLSGSSQLARKSGLETRWRTKTWFSGFLCKASIPAHILCFCLMQCSLKAGHNYSFSMPRIVPLTQEIIFLVCYMHK